MKKLIVILIIVFIIATIFYLQLIQQTNYKIISNLKQPEVVINQQRLYLEIASEPAKQIQGLSNRKILKSDHGMLFVYTDKKIRTFWMKDMNFPLDIIWINDNKIVGIDKNLPPAGSQPEKTYHSPEAVNYVLEVNAGLADRNQIKDGNLVKFSW